MNYLSVNSISKSFGIKTLFADVSFGVEKGDKTALIAANGSGKSTMLKILVGKESPDSGSIIYANDIKVGYLEQLPVYPRGTRIADLLADLDEEQQLKARQYLTRFALDALDQSVDALSGGQVKRLALALVRLHEPDLLILDEPTNHLDVEMVEWLEKFLTQSSMTLLMVTHDRYFLDRVCNKIFELYQGVMYTHHGNFDYYVQKSREREEVKRATVERNSQLLKHELEWMRSTPQARTGKSKSRIDAFYDLKERTKYQMEDNTLEFGLKMQRLGGKILEMSNVSKSYGDLAVLREFDYVFKRGERIGLIGKNGVGKSSFLNLITGNILPDHGRIKTGDTVTYGYYRQEGIRLDEDKSVIDTLRDIAEVLPYGKDKVYTADQLLAHFMFPYKMHRQPVSLLSGGEKRRLYLLTVLVRNPNFLILDEPTNDLDLLTLQKLEDFLQGYQGCLLVVSHDRFFMDQVVDQLFVFQGDGLVKGFMGNYSRYRDWLDAMRKEEKKEKTVSQRKDSRQTKPREKVKRSYNEQREYEMLEQEMASLEKERGTLTEALNGESDYQKLKQMGNRIQEINGLLDVKELRWLELDDIGG